MTNLRQALEAEITQFRIWADTIPVSQRSGEWELLYSDWRGIYRTFKAFVNASACQEWDKETVQAVLYIIARDNEMQELATAIAKHSDSLLCLAEQALVSQERDAKWQLATELGRLDTHVPRVESLLLQFTHDPDEYVQRRSLIALAEIRSPQVEKLVERAWETGNEYQRMAVLYALWKVGSLQLETFLARADADGRPYLAEYAARVREGNPL